MTVHGTVIAGPQRAVLIVGAAGSGKSALALDLMARGARLVADDRVRIEPRDGQLIASAPDTLRGLVELRGIGIGRVIPRPYAALSLVVDLDATPDGRQPDPLTWHHRGITLRRIAGRSVLQLCSVIELWLRDEIELIDEGGREHDKGDSR